MGLAYSWVSHHSVFVSLKSKIEGGFAMSSLSAKLEGALKPVVVSKMTTRLMVETPFTRSYPTTGVDMEWAAALPGRFSVEGEMKTADKKSDKFTFMPISRENTIVARRRLTRSWGLEGL